jgi:hypothetical protein
MLIIHDLSFDRIAAIGLRDIHEDVAHEVIELVFQNRVEVWAAVPPDRPLDGEVIRYGARLYRFVAYGAQGLVQ